GHADMCDTSVTPYHCVCLAESHTEGDNCQRCAPLYNAKPFRSGDQLQSYNCRPCQCHGHAHSCHYDITADAHPLEHYRGGGGVCDDCMHNTTGRQCERCASQFYRVEGAYPGEEGAYPGEEGGCRPCDCHTPGTVNGSLECDQVGGQCRCKSRVSGRRCDQCVSGSFRLQPWHEEGCLPCNCSAAGSAHHDLTCHALTGQCGCKPNVIGRTCDRCNYGYKLLNQSHPDGCVSCDCDPLGSTGPHCDPEGGQCECRPGVGGARCHACSRGLHGLHLLGVCSPCLCSPQGSRPGSTCDPHTGQCVCKEHTEGHRCDTCRRGYHSLERRNSLGCLPCACDGRGTVEGGVCDPTSGQCPCKEGVEGALCTRCAPHYYNMTSDLAPSAVCVSCMCDPQGAVGGTVCDGVTGQCVCVPTRHGRDCSACRPGYFASSMGSNQSVCVECACHLVGSSGQVCDGRSGQCVCAHPSVGGRRCDLCQELHYGFNPGLGRCVQCNCDPVGSVDAKCHPDSGRCVCKALVTGERCDSCVSGASHMDPNNYLGCSKAPSQQPPPVGVVLGPSSIRVTWPPPDSPNSHVLTYTLLRDGLEVHTCPSSYPFSSETFEDTGLSPYTLYSYRLLTANVNGLTESPAAQYRTSSSVPDPERLQLNLLGRSGPTGASFNWSLTQNHSGPLERFVLRSVALGSGQERLHYSGLATEASARGLTPHTRYAFTLQACTLGGCASSSPPLLLLTAPAPPQDQPPPRLNATGPHQIHACWDPPAQPNGVIIKYEILLRGPMELQENLTSPAPEQSVFISSGWLDLSIPPGSANGSADPPPESSAVVTGLQPFSTYQLRVLTVNMAGSVTSDWSSVRTEEGVPEFMPAPEVWPVSSSSLNVTWRSPRGQEARGEVTKYRVNLVNQHSSNPYAPSVLTQVVDVAGGDQRVYLAVGLEPYTTYSFSVTLCTRLACVHSQAASGRTLPAAPAGLLPPKLKPLNETTMQVSWDPPSRPNGPPPLYQVERTDLSLSDSDDPVVRGTRFPGNGYYRFPSDTLPVNNDFTGVQLSFRTRAPDGLLFYAVSPGSQEEYLALQIRNGRLYFLFDPQGSAVAVGLQGDGDRKYNDNQWHLVMATRKQAVGTIMVDDTFTGNASASSGSTIIGENTGVFIGGLPEDFPLHRQDSGDARLVQHGFSGCLRDVKVKMSDSPSEVWQPLDWFRATERVVALESWEGCPAHSEDGAHFLGQGYLELGAEVWRWGVEFEMSLEFRTDQLDALLLFSYDTQGEDYALAELEGGLLSWVLSWGGHVTHLSMWVGLSYCDGEWNQLSLVKEGSLISASLNDWSEYQRGEGGGRLRVDSPLYLGGVPPHLSHRGLASMSHRHGLGGCVRGVAVKTSLSGVPVVSAISLSASVRHSVRVNLDGCPATDSRFVCRGNDSVLVYTGRETQTRDHGLQPFTEYLYRVVASSAGGWTTGAWDRTRSHGTVPLSVPPPSRVESGSGFSAQVSWTPPSDVRGVIDRYELRAYDRDQPGSAPVSATYLSGGNFTGLLSGLTPFTRYIVTVAACTQAGCTESRRDNSGDGVGRWSLVTPEEAPEDVPPPDAVSHPSSLALTWAPPRRPNGRVTHFLLYQDGTLCYRGNRTQLNVTGLGVYSPHVFVLVCVRQQAAPTAPR
ncbi:usherin-like, partial [Osmerus eperlanus]|uniref:usherin-like n=1 Tax=Osmerus eperlanus TaxID=29151 RepID=UPI002E0F2AA9